jgi:hypothetical protein
LASDTAPNARSKQYAVTALGGTQTGVNAHSVSSPFTLTVERPAAFKLLGQPNPVTGVIANVGRNVFTVRTRKGVVPLSGQAEQTMIIETKISVPSGADTADTNSVRAALSAHIGLLSDQDAEIGTLAIDGVL